jgi:hypothetical protein
MNESAPATEQITDPAEAFERIRRQLALLTAAVEGFASRQQVIEARDYAPDLGRLIDLQNRLVTAVVALQKSPAIELTPETIAVQIARSAETLRHEDKALLSGEASRQRETLNTLISMVRSRESQRHALIKVFLIGVAVIPALRLSSSLFRLALGV